MTRFLSQLQGCAISVAILLPLAGCGLLPSFERREPAGQVAALWREDASVTVEGRLQGPPSQPGRCRLLYPDSGDPYALIGSTEPFGEGARVRITGPVALWSACETFRTIRVDQVGPRR